MTINEETWLAANTLDGDGMVGFREFASVSPWPTMKSYAVWGAVTGRVLPLGTVPRHVLAQYLRGLAHRQWAAR